MTEGIQEIVAGLPELKDVAGVCAVADERVARGDAAFAADLGVALARAYGRAEPLWQYRSVFGHLLRLLATTAGPENLTEALRLVSSPEAADRRRAYGRLAAWQSLAALAGVADGAGSAEAEARAAECAWFGFDARTDWFEQVAWDIGLAVLAATDTD
ncbi:DUF6183 family protein [Streptomyces albidoflavus]